MLRYEEYAVRHAHHRFGGAVSALDDLCNFALELFESEELVKNPPTFADNAVYLATTALYMSACRQCRGISLLFEHWMLTEAEVASRTLFETTTHLTFVLKPRVILRRGRKTVCLPARPFNNKVRARLFIYHAVKHHYRVMKRWMKTPGLKHMVLKENKVLMESMLDGLAAEVDPAWVAWLKGKPGAAGVSLDQLALSVGLQQDYSTIYGPGSLAVHGVNMNSYLERRGEDELPGPRLFADPNSRPSALEAAFICLVRCMVLLNERFSLNRKDELFEWAKKFRESLAS